MNDPVGAGGRNAAPSSTAGAQEMGPHYRHSEGHNPRDLGAEGEVPMTGPSGRDVGCCSVLSKWLCLLSLVMEAALQNGESRASF